MTQAAAAIFIFGYYVFGFSWLFLCVASRAIHGFPHPLVATIWIAVAAAFWPILAFKLLRAVARGEKQVDLSL